MNIIEKRIEIKSETQARIKEIKYLIEKAYSLYAEYKNKAQKATKQDCLNVIAAINKFYKDDSRTICIGNLMYDEVPVSMYASMKCHKYAICRNAIKQLDKELARQGIVVEELLDFKEIEEKKSQQEDGLSL
ncbi:MAG: hypothetical protein IJA69_04490 [Clostridia bacterium]|nr:hypothetical protein [Clostridia bacterium]